MRAIKPGVTRKIAIIVAAILVPGGLIALFGAALFKAMQRTERGRKVISLARRSVPAMPAYFRGAQRQAA